jgi:hypothetical protein
MTLDQCGHVAVARPAQQIALTRWCCIDRLSRRTNRVFTRPLIRSGSSWLEAVELSVLAGAVPLYDGQNLPGGSMRGALQYERITNVVPAPDRGRHYVF